MKHTRQTKKSNDHYLQWKELIEDVQLSILDMAETMRHDLDVDSVNLRGAHVEEENDGNQPFSWDDPVDERTC